MSEEVETLPDGQILLLNMPPAYEGAELLKSQEERQADNYPLTTIEKDQERLQSIIHMLAADAPLRFICRAHRVGWHTLESIRAKQGTKIAAIKKTIAKRMTTFVQLGIEQLLDDVTNGKIKGERLGVTVGIIADKMQVLTGEATSIIGSTSDKPRMTAESLREKLAGSSSIEIEVTEAAPPGFADQGEIQSVTDPAAIEAGSDNQSDINSRK